MRIYIVTAFLYAFILGCSHHKGPTSLTANDSTSVAHVKTVNDTLDTLSIRILQFYGMRNLSDYVGLTAQTFLDTVPFSTWDPTFGHENGVMNTVYVHYAGTDILMILRMKDSPYEATLANQQLLKLEPERMLQLNIEAMELYLRSKCVKRMG